jgi:hypothetical protein
VTSETRLVTLLSHWLARHVDDDELRTSLDTIGAAELSPAQAQAVAELRAELDDPDGQSRDLEMVVRETLEALALEG